MRMASRGAGRFKPPGRFVLSIFVSTCRNFSHGPFQTDRRMRNVSRPPNPPVACQASHRETDHTWAPFRPPPRGRRTGANFKNIFHKFLKAEIKNHRSTWYVLTSSDTPNFGFEFFLLLISCKKCHKLLSW